MIDGQIARSRSLVSACCACLVSRTCLKPSMRYWSVLSVHAVNDYVKVLHTIIISLKCSMDSTRRVCTRDVAIYSQSGPSTDAHIALTDGCDESPPAGGCDTSAPAFNSIKCRLCSGGRTNDDRGFLSPARYVRTAVCGQMQGLTRG